MRTRSGKVNSSLSEENSKSPQKKSTEEKAANLVDSILKSVNKNVSGESEPKDVKPKQNSLTSIKKKPVVVRGLPKSGRPWKDVKKRFCTIKKSAHRRTFEKKQELRNDLKHIKELSKSIKEDRKQENAEKRRRREENAQKRLENERKNEIVQIIKNPAKLKRMKKKALRKIEKRDLTLGNGPKVV